MKKYLIIMLMLLVTFNFVGAVYSGEDFKITTVDLCFDEAYVKVTAQKEIARGDYNIKGCKLKDVIPNIWVCNCDGNSLDFVLQTKETTKDTYDITIQYYIEPLTKVEENGIDFGYNRNTYGERVLTFNNVVVEPRAVKPEGIKWPAIGDSSTITTIIIIVVVVLIVLILLWLGFKFMFSGGSDTRTVKPKQPLIAPKPRFKHMKIKPKTNISQVKRSVTDEEVEEFLKTL